MAWRADRARQHFYPPCTPADTGQNRASYAYDGFGNELLTSDKISNPFRFGGKVGYDSGESKELVYVRARWYDPALARWISEDPIGFDGGDSDLYRYVMNSPITTVDPAGLRSCTRTQLKIQVTCYKFIISQIGKPKSKTRIANTSSCADCCSGLTDECGFDWTITGQGTGGLGSNGMQWSGWTASGSAGQGACQAAFQLIPATLENGAIDLAEDVVGALKAETKSSPEGPDIYVNCTATATFDYKLFNCSD